MAADVDVVVVDVALVAEEGVGLGYLVGGEEGGEAGELALLGGEPPGLEVEVERVVVHDVLAETLEAPLRAHLADAVEPRKVTPGPEARGEDVREHEGVHKFGEHEYLHVGERHGGRFFLVWYVFHFFSLGAGSIVKPALCVNCRIAHLK